MNVSELTNAINATATEVPTLSEEERLGLLTARQKLAGTLETPMEATLKYVFSVHNGAGPNREHRVFI